MTNDGRWLLTWDAENRLTKAESRSDAPSLSRCKVEWTYDYRGRRVRQTDSVWNPSTLNYEPSTDTKFISDGWRHIAELNATNNALVRSYVWGLDLSGSLYGAGGVGGLLMINSIASGAHFYAYDGNGNVTALVQASDGAISQQCEYEPFGGIIRNTGLMAGENRFLFSTKRCDPTTDLELYEYRVRRTDLAWLNRDLIEERGGLNLYGNGSDLINFFDPFGLNLYAIDGTGNDESFNTNVRKFRDRYKDGRAPYYRGPGNQIDGNTWFGPGWGAGSAGIVKAVVKQICEDYSANPDIKIDIVGFSRGAAIANEVATELKRNGCKCHVSGPHRTSYKTEKPQVRFLGLFDPVYSFPIIDQWTWNDTTIPGNVLNAAIPYASDENRSAFRPAMLRPENSTTTFNTQWFPGVHSDVGGSNDRNLLIGAWTLRWMVDQAVRAGVNVDTSGLLTDTQIQQFRNRGFFVPFQNSGITTLLLDSRSR